MDQEIRIAISKSKATAYTLIAAGILAFSAWAFFKVWILPAGSNKTFLLAVITIWGIATGLACFYGFLKLMYNQPGLILNKNGLHINIGPNRGQFIHWQEIKGLKIYNPARGPMTLLIFVKNPSDLLARTGAFKRFLLKMNNMSHKTPVSLTSNWLNCSFEELVTIIDNKYKTS